MKHKIIALTLCLVLILTTVLPGTLAIQNDTTMPSTDLEETVTDSSTEIPMDDADVPEDSAENANAETVVSDPTDTATTVTLFDQLMACTSYAQLQQLLSIAQQSELNTMSSAQLAALEEKINSLAPPLDLSNVGDTLVAGDETVNGPSETRELTYDFTDAAPFGAPVTADSLRALAKKGTSEDDNGLETDKTFAFKDGSTTQGTLTLEAWATGEYMQSTVTSEVPTDIILVLDQSGSMDDAFDTVTRNSYHKLDNSNMQNYPLRQNGGSDNIWYECSDDTFVRVNMSVTQNSDDINWESCISYHIPWGNCLWNSDMVNWSDAGILYQLLDDGTYARCYVTGGILSGGYTYTYADGTSEHVNVGSNPTKVDKERFFHAEGLVNTYRYFYVNEDGTEIEIETSVGDNTKPSKTYYSLQTTTTDRTKLVALQDAVNQFVTSVKNKAQTNNVAHRIAIVGFASGNKWNGQSYNYNNTEVFIGSTQYKYGTDASGQYGNAFQNMTTSAGVTNVTNSINALDADGGTMTNLGLEMANGIFKANPLNTTEKRNRVVIVFTDGQPGWSGYDSSVANSAVSQASIAKNTYGATVYTVGIFEGANVDGNDQTNKFMRNMSSGTGYYLTASNSEKLNQIFEKLASNIEESGGSANEKLDASTVLQDVVSDYFRLPEGTTKEDIKVYTAAVDEKTGNFLAREPYTGANVVVDEKNQTVKVTNFDYSANWVGSRTVNGTTTYGGKKLIVEFDINVRDGFLGGNDVITNGTGSAIIDGDGKTVEAFVSPTANIPIQDITITAADKNVYLTQVPSEADLKDGLVIKCGNVDITDPSKLEDWQKAYVDLESSFTAPTDFDATADGTYSVKASVSPKTSGNTTDQGEVAVTKEKSTDGNIYVFKPELTFKDSTVYYGDTVPADFTANKTAEVWKHGETLSTAVTMLGTMPALSLTCTPEADKISAGKVNTKQDFAVDVAVKIDSTDVTDDTLFQHTDCADQTCGTPDNGKFWLHVKTCALTVTKSGGSSEEPYVFTVYKDGQKYTEVTTNGNESVTIYELPVGTYTIREDANWSWRYTATYSGSGVLSPDHPTGALNCANTLTNDHWLNGFSAIARNIFGEKH